MRDVMMETHVTGPRNNPVFRATRQYLLASDGVLLKLFFPCSKINIEERQCPTRETA